MSPSCPHPCLLLAKRNSGLGIHDLCFSSQLLQLFDEGWRKEEEIMSFAGKNGILLLLFPLRALPSMAGNSPDALARAARATHSRCMWIGKAFSPSAIFKRLD